MEKLPTKFMAQQWMLLEENCALQKHKMSSEFSSNCGTVFCFFGIYLTNPWILRQKLIYFKINFFIVFLGINQKSCPQVLLFVFQLATNKLHQFIPPIPVRCPWSALQGTSTPRRISLQKPTKFLSHCPLPFAPCSPPLPNLCFWATKSSRE